MTNLELTGAYAAIANGGVYTKPRFYTRILDRDGNVILGEESETRQVLSSETAFLLTDAMSDSLEPHQLFARPGISINSTSTRARLSRMPAAGKSGTTTSNRDAWFVGFTDYYTAGIWTGYDENNKELANTSYHKSIWKQIMDRIHEGTAGAGLFRPGFHYPGVDLPEIRETCGFRAVRRGSQGQYGLYGIFRGGNRA